jgi:surface polysaccharide O-acyltransferase-like enzyme
MKKERMKELDVLRVVGFVFVVAQHILGAYAWSKGASFQDSLVLSFLYVAAKPAVPIFVTVTAISLCHAYLGKMDILRFYQKRFLYIFVPYVIWTIFNIFDAKQYGPASFDHFFWQVLAGTGRYHLWYMSMIIRFYLLFPLILWLTQKGLKRGILFKTVFLIGFFVFYTVLLKNDGMMDSLARFIFGNPTIHEQRFCERTPLLWSIYFVIGIYMFAGNSQFKALLRRFQKPVLITYLFLLGTMYYAEISPHFSGHPEVPYGYRYCFFSISFMIFSVFVFYSLGLYIAAQMPRLYYLTKETAGNTYAAYLAHVIVLQAVAEEVNGTCHLQSFLVSGLIILALTVALTLLLVEAFKALPLSQYWLGTKNRGQPKISPQFLDHSAFSTGK